MDLTIYPLSSFAVCTGKREFDAQKAQYKRDVSAWETGERSKSNIWDMKNDQYEINTAENVNAYSRHIAASQRNFGLDVQEFMKNNETLFQNELAKAPVNEGNRSTGFGRSMKLAALYEKSAQNANIRRGGIQFSEKQNAAYRQLLSAQSSELGKRGFAPIPSPHPVPPKGPSFLDQAIGVASTAASFIAPISSIGGMAGIGMTSKMGGFTQRFFQPDRLI